MKKLFYTLAITLTCCTSYAQIDASNLPPVVPSTNDSLMLIHGGPASLATVPGLGNILSPFLNYGNLGGTLPATVTLTNGQFTAFSIVSTNITTNIFGNTQTNYWIQPYNTNGLTMIVTNLISSTVSNRMTFVQGIFTGYSLP